MTSDDEGVRLRVVKLQVVGAKWYVDGVHMSEGVTGRVAGVEKNMVERRRRNSNLGTGGRDGYTIGKGDEEGGEFVFQDWLEGCGIGVKRNMGNPAQWEAQDGFNHGKDRA